MGARAKIVYSLVITLFVGAFLIQHWGERGELPASLQTTFYPLTQRVGALLTDLKFRLRGPKDPGQKVVIVEIDSQSIEALGRWPWRRDYIAYLIEKTFQAGAKAIGLDIVFSESQKSVPEELEAALKAQGPKCSAPLKKVDFDKKFSQVIRKNASRLVLAWVSEAPCRPRFSEKQDCPVTAPEAVTSHPESFKKFALEATPQPDVEASSLVSVPTLIPNLASFNEAASHAGFANDFRDPDGVVRHADLVLLENDRAQPALALALASLAWGEKPKLELTEGGVIRRLYLPGQRKELPVSSWGMAGINFYGPDHTFTYVSAVDVLDDKEVLEDSVNRKLAGIKKTAVLKDAIVLIGISALALGDLAATPFDRGLPGVEVHATVLDNLLTGNFFGQNAWAFGVCLFLMTAGVAAYLSLAARWEAYPAIALFLATLTTLFAIDVKLLFAHNENWNTAFLYLELTVATGVLLLAKYIKEENSRKFLKFAFSKYVSPAVVEALVADPAQLSLGGEKKPISVLFADIRNFTAFSEKVDATKLSQFLLEFHTLMTDIIFKEGGTLDKYIGDALMVFWGAPLEQNDHALRSCRAAVAMQNAVRDFRPKFLEKYGVTLEVGIGINTGIVAVGNMGSERSFGYTVIGDHVNLASRLQTATKKFKVKILVARYTLQSVEKSGNSAPAHRPLGKIRLRGKDHSIDVVQILESPLPEAALQSFEEGIREFQSKKFKSAREAFQKAQLALGGKDGPCDLYLKLCEFFESSPPSADWDGSLDFA